MSANIEKTKQTTESIKSSPLSFLFLGLVCGFLASQWFIILSSREKIDPQSINLIQDFIEKNHDVDAHHVRGTKLSKHNNTINTDDAQARPLPSIFPPGCTWQCYLVKNPDIREALGWSEEAAIQHYQQLGYNEPRICNECSTTFPGSCTWKSYLDLNPDVRKKLQENIVLYHYSNKEDRDQILQIEAFQHYQKHALVEKRRCSPQKVVLLAGPHKAASTTLQTFAIQLSDMSRNDASIRKDSMWNWIDPPSIQAGAKSFADLLFSYFNIPYVAEKYNGTHYVKMEELVQPNFPLKKQIFKQQIQNQYEKGLNIILGSEEIDRISKDDVSDKFIDELKSIMPQPVLDKDQMTAIVMYRSPRIRHLYSAFKELLRHPDVGKLTFHEYFNSKHFFNQYSTIDSLKLANVLVNKGLKVKIVDMSGLSSSPNENYVHLLGCTIMQMDCVERLVNDTAYVLPEALVKSPAFEEMFNIMKQPMNVRKDVAFGKISKDQMDEIDKLMTHYDCNFIHLRNERNREKVEILYGQDLIKNWDKCDTYEAKPPSLTHLVTSMRKVLGWPTNL